MGRCSAIGKDGVATLIVDFSSHASIHKAAADFKERFGRLDILVLNAGIVQGPADLIWQTNHVGPFVFTEALRPLLESAASTHGDARVVAVSSRTHQLGHIRYEGPYNSDKPYSQSKLAQILHMRELQRRSYASHPEWPKSALRCLAVTPGFTATNIFKVSKLPFCVRSIASVSKFLFFPVLARSASTGAQTILTACLDDTLEGGEYLVNCLVEPSGACANHEDDWSKCWALTEACINNGLFT